MLCDTCENRSDCKSREAYTRLYKFTNGTMGMCSGYKYEMKEPPPIGIEVIFGSRCEGKTEMLADKLKDNPNVIVVRKKDRNAPIFNIHKP